jgi:hypothetical protein
VGFRFVAERLRNLAFRATMWYGAICRTGASEPLGNKYAATEDGLVDIWRSNRSAAARSGTLWLINSAR